jgi:hypothetical protein
MVIDAVIFRTWYFIFQQNNTGHVVVNLSQYNRSFRSFTAVELRCLRIGINLENIKKNLNMNLNDPQGQSMSHGVYEPPRP